MIDSHAHIFDESFSLDLENVINNAKNNAIIGVKNNLFFMIISPL